MLCDRPSFLRRPARRVALSFSATLLMVLSALSSAAAQAPVCKGADITEELRRDHPAEWTRVMATADATANAKALFWKVEKAGTLASYVFGTVHLTNERINALPAVVDRALTTAKTVALEVADLSAAAMGPALAGSQQLLVYTDGRSLMKLLTADERGTAERALKDGGMPAEALAALKPWVVSMMLALPGCERKRAATGLEPLDQRLGNKARAKGIPVVGLETLADQMRAMAKVPDGDQLEMLRASLKLFHRADDLIETMVQLYLKRELGQIWPMQELLWRIAGHDPAALNSFRRELIGIRNGKMRDAALPILAKGNAFIAVGALHLPGDDGLVELFRKAGYKVTPAE